MSDHAYRAIIDCMDHNARSTEWAMQTALDCSAYISTSDVETLEMAGEALIRSGDTPAIAVLALALRLRAETGLQPERRASDAVT